MKAWVFDIDGVITNLLKEKVEHTQIIEEIKQKLEKGDIVALVTGRGFWWVEENIFPHLKEILLNKNWTKRLFMTCEFGGVTITFQNGKQIKNVERDIIPPQSIFDEGYEILNTYKDTIEKESKETLFTLKIKEGTDFKTFKNSQKRILKELDKLLSKLDLKSEFETHHDRIGINIRNKKQDKHLAIQKFIGWLKLMNLKPNEYYVFGDSDSDLEMGNELKTQNKQFKFIYVGEELKITPNFQIIKTNKKYDEGTLEYLRGTLD